MKSAKIKLNRKNTKAFTLVESLVAISILMIAVASPLTLSQKGITAAELSKDQMTASYLAQDGIEAVKNIRDQVAVSAPSNGSQANWLYGLSNCVCSDTDLNCSTFAPVPTVKYCNIDTTDPTLLDGTAVIPNTQLTVNPLQIATNNINHTFLKYDLLPAPVGYTNIASKFSRKIDIRQTPGNPNEAAVNVQISWISQIGPQSMTIKDFIYNYSENIQ